MIFPSIKSEVKLTALSVARIGSMSGHFIEDFRCPDILKLVKTSNDQSAGKYFQQLLLNE